MATKKPTKTQAADNEPADTQPTELHDRQAQPVDTEEAPRLPFPVVGIGASAGGLEACIEFFDAMPDDSGVAFVLVQHLPPDRECLLADSLSKHTRMPVHQIEDGMSIEPNHVYVIRPGHTLTMQNGTLRLGESLQKPGHNRPVDDFFRSLAEEQRERAICIIMSGMGSNGSAGTEMIKAVGGAAIAQDPESAKYPSMPRHLIDSGNADFILRPHEMPAVLVRYASHAYVRDREPAETAVQRERHYLNEILVALRSHAARLFGLQKADDPPPHPAPDGSQSGRQPGRLCQTIAPERLRGLRAVGRLDDSRDRFLPRRGSLGSAPSAGYRAAGPRTRSR